LAGHSLQETAQRAGATTDRVAELVELGLVTPERDGSFSDTAARRAAVVLAILESGITAERLARAIRGRAVSLDFVDDPTYERFAAVSGETFAQLAERTGIPMELLSTIREALGSPPPSPTDLVRDQEAVVARTVQLSLEEAGSPESLARLLRVIGDSMRRIAETEADWWYAEILAPRLARGLKDEELNVASQVEMSHAMDASIIAIFHARQARTWMKNVTQVIGGQMSEAGLHEQVERYPAICFLDVTGYTRLTQERGDAAAADLAEKLTRIVQRTSAHHGGRPIKWLGDGVMFYFDEPAEGVVAALEMVAGVAQAGLPPAHVGVNCGPVLFQEGDYFGQTVNVAARIADFARPGEVLVSHAVVEATSDDGVAFSEIGPVELKGVSDPVRLHAARLVNPGLD
jgi:adenylate cyclase